MNAGQRRAAHGVWVDLVDRSLPAELLEGDADRVRRARATIAGATVATIAFVLIGVARLAGGAWSETLVLTGFALLCAMLPAVLRRTCSLILVGNLLAAYIFAATMSATVVTGGRLAAPAFAVATAPMVAVLVAGPMWGLLWTTLASAALVYTAIQVAKGVQPLYLPPQDLIEGGRFPVALILVLVTFVAMVLHEWLKKAAVEDLARSEGRYRALIESSPLGVLGWDGDGRVVAVNDKLLEMLGAPVDDARPQRFNMLADPVLEEAGVTRMVRRCMGEERMVVGEVAFRSAWGKDVDLRVRMAPLYDLEGRVRGAEAVVEDICEERRLESERRRLDEQMAHSQKLKSIGVLAGGIAHDFNNLLTVILGNAGLAIRQTEEDHPVRRKLQQIESSAKHAARLTEQMLAYAGKGQLVKEAMHLSDLVDNLSELIQASTPRRVHIHRELGSELPIIHADMGEIRQVVMNLITNAVEAVGDPAGGNVWIRTSAVEVVGEEGSRYFPEPLEPGTYVRLEVRDDGVGMDPETQRKIFDPFFTTKFLGRGLGLSSLLGIVRGHRGGLELESEVDRGTTFRVLFPVGSAEPAIVPAVLRRNRAEEELRGRTVLVADDEQDVLDTVEAMLTAEGFVVLTACDGEAALRVFEEHAEEVAAVLLDVSMPVMGGLDAARAIRRVDPRIPVVFASGYGEQSVRDEVRADPRATFVPKPYQTRGILDALAAVILVDDPTPDSTPVFT